MTSERWAWAEVDLDAVAANVAWLREVARPAAVWAVVKADGYGHGAVPVARAALGAGAAGLCVALAQEGAELRAHGLRGPVLLLSEPPPELFPLVVAEQFEPMLYTASGIAAGAEAARAAGGRPLSVHLKVDTGMHRVGASPSDALARARQIVEQPGLRLAGVATHLAVADEPDHPATARQLACLDAVLAELHRHGIDPPVVHAANSAAAIGRPAARRSLVRAGIAVYGIPPSVAMAEAAAPLRPAMTLRARVSHVQHVRAGEGVSYGLRHVLSRDTTVATLPIGYADGVPRRLFGTGGEVLIGGRRHPIVGVVTMDQLMVDCGPRAEVRVGDEAVLIGTQGGETITATEWAERLGTIAYEVVCGIGARVPRRYPSGQTGPADSIIRRAGVP